VKNTALIAALAAMLASASAHAVENEAYVLLSKPATNGVAQQQDLIYALMVKDPCMLNLANAGNLRMAAIFNDRRHPERPDVGCWGISANPSGAEVVVIGPTGHVSTGMALTQFKRASLNPDGSATTLGPAITQEQLQQNMESYARKLRQP
jgi:hypothetical protein